MAQEGRRDENTARLGQFFRHGIGWVTRHPWLMLSFCVLTAGLSLYVSLTKLQQRTQRDDLMSAHQEVRQRWQRYLNEFGNDDDIVVVVEGDDLPEMRQSLDQLAERIREQPRHFDRLFYRVDLTPLKNRALMMMNAEELKLLETRLDAMSPLFGRLALIAWQQITLENLLAQANSILKKPEAQRTPSDRDLLAQLQSILRSASEFLADPSKYSNPWGSLVQRSPEAGSLDEPQFFTSADGSLAFLLVRPVQAEEKSFTPAAEAVEQLRALLAQAQSDHPRLRFGLTGLPVLENDEMTASDQDSMRASWLALLGVALLYFFVYRGVRYPLLTLSSLILGTVWALGLTTVTVGYLTILSSTFAVMLIGMGDYGVLWIARYREERTEGKSVADALASTSEHAGPSILVAAITTALAFYATTLTDFQAIRELGFIAGSGVLLCALACFLLTPALLVLTERNAAPAPSDEAPAEAGEWLPFVSRHPLKVIAVAASLFLIAAGLATKLNYDHSLLRMQAAGLDSVKWELKLLEKTTGSSWHAISIADSAEEALALKAKFEQLPEVGRVVEMASLVPPDQERKIPAVQAIAKKLHELPAMTLPIDPLPTNRPALMRSLSRLSESGDDDLKGAANDLLDAMRDADDAVVRERFATFHRTLAWDLLGGLHRLKEVSEPREIALNELPPELRERFIGAHGQWLVRAYARENLWEFDRLRRFVEATRSVDPEVTGKPFGTLEGLVAMKGSFQKAGLYALIAIVLILYLDFRSLSCLLLALMPLALGVVLSLGLLKLLGYALNPANLIALPLIVGVGIDNGVHVLHDYRAHPRGEGYRLSAATGRGILVAALTTLLGFGTLMLARHQGLASLGLTLSLGVGACMLASLIVLPAVLRLIDRAAHRPPPNLHRIDFRFSRA